MFACLPLVLVSALTCLDVVAINLPSLVHWNTILLSTSEAASQPRPSGEPFLLNTAVVSGSTVRLRDMCLLSSIIAGAGGLMSTMIFDNTESFSSLFSSFNVCVEVLPVWLGGVDWVDNLIRVVDSAILVTKYSPLTPILRRASARIFEKGKDMNK